MPKASILNINRSIFTELKYPVTVFSISISFRLIIEILAWPYPVGYDVINYYLPVLTNFDSHWSSTSNQFPLYILLLHTIYSVLQIDPRILISISIVILFGLFSLVIYSIGKNIFHLSNNQSIFLSLFVIFQVSLLRTSWDLHKDMFALSIALFCLSSLARIPSVSKHIRYTILPLSIISILSDRMIGFVLSTAYILYALIRRKRIIATMAMITGIIFAISLLGSTAVIRNNTLLGNVENEMLKQSYNSLNLVILLLVMSGFLLPTGVLGFLRSNNATLKIPLVISLMASFSWILYPNTSAFLPDRWIVIFSIFMSIFSGYGFVLIVEGKHIGTSYKKLRNYFIVLIPFLFLGFTFATSPNNSYLNLYSVFHPYISYYGPLTMQYNSISLPESESLLSLIRWINNNTPSDAIIIGSKHVRGWMELELANRTFLYDINITDMLNSNNYGESYLLDSNTEKYNLQNYSKNLSFKNNDFSLYYLNPTTPK